MRNRTRAGQALIEFALILPLGLLLIVNVVNFGAFFYAALGVANAARAGADYLMMGPASAGYTSFPTATQVSNVVKADMANLPNGATATVTICTNNNGSIQSPGTCLATVSDPDPTLAVVGQVNVSYTYSPIISAFSFGKVHLTLPTTSINRHAAVRLIQ